MVFPKLGLDTNICGILTASAYLSDAERIVERMNRRFRLVVLPQTFVELVDSMLDGDDAHFDTCKARLRLMVGSGKPEFLRLPSDFALRKVLGLVSAVPKLGPRDFEEGLRVVLHAKSRRELFDGGVRLPLGRRRVRRGFDPQIIRQQQEEGRAQHQQYLKRVRDQDVRLLSPDQWAAGIAHPLGHKLSAEQAGRLAEGLDAAYQYDAQSCAVSRHRNYNFGKHRGDYIDSQQLYYLCDPSFHLLTDDGGLRNRAGASHQKGQILDFRAFLKQQGFATRH